jgi:hypothetical protein
MFKRSSTKSKVHPKPISPKKDLVYSFNSATYTQSSLKDDNDNVIDFLSEYRREPIKLFELTNNFKDKIKFNIFFKFDENELNNIYDKLLQDFIKKHNLQMQLCYVKLYCFDFTTISEDSDEIKTILRKKNKLKSNNSEAIESYDSLLDDVSFYDKVLLDMQRQELMEYNIEIRDTDLGIAINTYYKIKKDNKIFIFVKEHDSKSLLSLFDSIIIPVLKEFQIEPLEYDIYMSEKHHPFIFSSKLRDSKKGEDGYIDKYYVEFDNRKYSIDLLYNAKMLIYGVNNIRYVKMFNFLYKKLVQYLLDSNILLKGYYPKKTTNTILGGRKKYKNI